MKRFIIWFLAAAMVVSLAGCGGGQTPAGDDETPGGEQAGDGGPAGPQDGAEPDTPPEQLPDEPPEVEPAPPDDSWRETVPHYTLQELPRFDGSTATAPLAVTLCAAILGVSEEEAEGYVSFNRTTNSYYNLLYGMADILIAGEGNQEVYDQREQEGFEWEQTPFATDAFVFVVNEDNPVDSLTIDEIRGIYTGRITNWSQLGGEDREIVPLQRNPEAGSQSLMEKLVMRGTPMMEPPKEYIAASMGELMEAVRGYDRSPGAIGYSVYYYAEEMRAAEGLKLLKLEGVEPLPDTIRSGEYPLTNPYYVVIPASAPEDSPARVIRDWLLSEDGQRMAASQGYVSVMDFPTARRAVLPIVGTRLSEGFIDALEPGDYGALVPYAGQRLVDHWAAETGCLYGLMTREGQVVVDPVYIDVWICGDVLVLEKAAGERQLYAAAARDGSWVTDFDYERAYYGLSGVLLLTEDTVTVIRANGERLGALTREEIGATEDDFRQMLLGPMEGGGSEWMDDKISVAYNWESVGGTVRYYDLATGGTGTMSMDDWYGLYPDVPRRDPLPGAEDAYRISDLALGDDAPGIWEQVRMDEYSYSTVTYHYYRDDGTPIPELTVSGGDTARGVRLIDGIAEKVETNVATYYDYETLEVVFRTYLGNEDD